MGVSIRSDVSSVAPGQSFSEFSFLIYSSMKKIVTCISFVFLCLAACSGTTSQDGGSEPVPVKWETKQIREGLTWMRFRGKESLTGKAQVINVLDLDLQSSDLVLEFQYYDPKITLSDAIARTSGAIAGTNASFGTPHTFIRTGGTTWCDLSEADPNVRGNWYKHEAAIWYDGAGHVGFLNYEGDPYGAIPAYQATTWPNMFSTEPLLIENHEYVTWSGKKGFITTVAPRTAVALLDNGHLLFITVDGRWYGMAAGMTIAELRDFIKLNFDPAYAINMDGGGSTTMYIEGYGEDGVVNYPCNSNGASTSGAAEYDGSFTERKLPSFFVIKEKPMDKAARKAAKKARKERK